MYKSYMYSCTAVSLLISYVECGMVGVHAERRERRQSAHCARTLHTVRNAQVLRVDGEISGNVAGLATANVKDAKRHVTHLTAA